MNHAEEFFTSLVKDDPKANRTDAMVSWLGIKRRDGETDEQLMERYRQEKKKLGMW